MSFQGGDFSEKERVKRKLFRRVRKTGSDGVEVMCCCKNERKRLARPIYLTNNVNNSEFIKSKYYSI